MNLYMRYYDKDGNVSIQQHQVWDKARFIEERQKEYQKEGGSAVVTTEADYREHNWVKR